MINQQISPLLPTPVVLVPYHVGPVLICQGLKALTQTRVQFGGPHLLGGFMRPDACHEARDAWQHMVGLPAGMSRLGIG